MENYRPRLADKTLERKLKGKGAVLIQGPKWCGKTTTAEQRAKSILYISNPEDVKANLRSSCNDSHVHPKNRAKARFLLDGLCKFSTRKTWDGGRNINGCKSSFTAALPV